MRLFPFLPSGVIAAVLALGSLESFAQAVPQGSPLQRSPLERITPPAQPKATTPTPQPAPPVATPEGGAQFHLTDVKVDGATVYGNDVLESFFAPLKNGVTTSSQVNDAVNQLQYKYRKDGYFLTKVEGTLEYQNGDTAVLSVHVIEGYIASVDVEGDVGPVANLVNDYVSHLIGIRPLKITDLERYLLLSQDVPGISIRTVLQAIQGQSGAVQLGVQLERKKFDGRIVDDNRGPKTAGPNELLISGGANSFTSLGDRTEIEFFNTPFDNEELFGQASYQAFIGNQGLRLKGYVGYGELVPGDILRPAGYKSRLLLTGLDAQYPVIRTRDLSVYLNGKFDISQTVIDLDDFTPTADHRASKDYLRIFRFGGKTDLTDTIFGPAFTAGDSASFMVHHGVPGLFSGTQDGALRTGRPKEVDDFTKLTAELQRTQNLYGWSVSSLELYLAATGQWTDDILPPSEELYLGGAEYGRGFYNGEVIGDRGVAGTVELRLNDEVDTGFVGLAGTAKLTYYLFYDNGQTYSLSPGDLSHHIETMGLGIRATVMDDILLQLEGVKRFTRRPTGTNTSLEPAQALFFRIEKQF